MAPRPGSPCSLHRKRELCIYLQRELRHLSDNLGSQPLRSSQKFCSFLCKSGSFSFANVYICKLLKEKVFACLPLFSLVQILQESPSNQRKEMQYIHWSPVSRLTHFLIRKCAHLFPLTGIPNLKLVFIKDCTCSPEEIWMKDGVNGNLVIFIVLITVNNVLAEKLEF